MNLLPRKVNKKYDLVVIGGGMAGICAAIAAARGGAEVALVENRPMLGGNASSAVRMHICGANCQLLKKNVNETGILMELLLENKRLNPNFNFDIWDTVLIDAVKKTEGLDLYLNTVMHTVECDGEKIIRTVCYQSTTERTLNLEGKLFMDCTGHGTLGFFAGAEYRMGSEGRAEFGEADAEDTENGNLMGNTLLFKAVDRGHPVEYKKPDWSYTFTEEQLAKRIHRSFSGSLCGDKVTEEGKGLPELYCADYGYWWIELGGDSGDIIGHGEEIRDELMRSLWGIWDHIKNGGDHGAQNYDLQWCGIVPGTRDSRRLVGTYLLNENDILANRVFEDAVAYGGWPMDVHTPGGLKDTDKSPSRVINFDGLYTIPYRCFYSSNIKNLMMAGRIISATKMAMSSARVMATCAVGGQAAGTAAAVCLSKGKLPGELDASDIRELRELLVKDDCYIPYSNISIPGDLAAGAEVFATSEAKGFEARNVINGKTRADESGSNCWRSEGICAEGETLTLKFGKSVEVNEIRLIFDPDLSAEMSISLSSKKQAQQLKTLPPQLVRSYRIAIKNNGKEEQVLGIEENRVRLAVHKINRISANEIEIRITSSYGADFAAVYEVSVY